MPVAVLLGGDEGVQYNAAQYIFAFVFSSQGVCEQTGGAFLKGGGSLHRLGVVFGSDQVCAPGGGGI